MTNSQQGVLPAEENSPRFKENCGLILGIAAAPSPMAIVGKSSPLTIRFVEGGA